MSNESSFFTSAADSFFQFGPKAFDRLGEFAEAQLGIYKELVGGNLELASAGATFGSELSRSLSATGKPAEVLQSGMKATQDYAGSVRELVGQQSRRVLEAQQALIGLGTSLTSDYLHSFAKVHG